MSSERLYRTEAIVLRRADFGEADRLLTLLTPKEGKIRAIAKGVRRPTSRKSGHVELFTHTELLIARGRHLDIITQAQTIESFVALRQDLMRLTYAHYVAELMDRFAEEGSESHDFFALMLSALRWLGEDRDLALTARFFEMQLLGLSGFQPQLFHCVECWSLLTPEEQFFDPDAGGVLCRNCGPASRTAQPLSLPAFKVLRFLQTRPHEIVRVLRLNPDTHEEVERHLQRYLSHVLERHLKSVAFLDLIRRQSSNLEMYSV